MYKLDYGCFIYGSARKSYRSCLDSIHHLGLRLALSALRTSPVESLYVEANEAPLSLRREKLALQYYTKLQSCPSNPVFECNIDPKYKEMFARKESAIPSFGIRIQSLLDTSNIPNDNVYATVIPQVPPWTLFRSLSFGHYFIEVYMCYILEYVSWVVASARWTVCPRG